MPGLSWCLRPMGQPRKKWSDVAEIPDTCRNCYRDPLIAVQRRRRRRRRRGAG